MVNVKKLILLILLLGNWACAQAAALLTAMNVMILPHHSHTHALILTFNQPITFKTFSLTQPDRLVIDIANTQFTNTTIDWRNTPIQAFRHGIQQGVNLRLVFTVKPGVTYNYTTTKCHRGFQIILMLTTPISNTPSIHTPLSDSNHLKLEHPDHQINLKHRTVTDDKIATLITDKINNLISLPTNKPFIVVIDAGHGGKDPGTIGGGGIKEKNITLAIARDVQQLVAQQSDMRAVMTRHGDYYVGLRQRLMLARKAHGDVFVAIHADAYNAPDANGAAVFALSPHGASSESALWLAKQENYSELGSLNLNIASSEDKKLRALLINLSQTATTVASVKLGNAVLQQLQQITQLHYDTVQQAPFMVLKSPDIPSILIETGFLSNPKEEVRLNTSTYQHQLAQAIFKGIQQYDLTYASRNMRLVRLG